MVQREPLVMSVGIGAPGTLQTLSIYLSKVPILDVVGLTPVIKKSLVEYNDLACSTFNQSILIPLDASIGTSFNLMQLVDRLTRDISKALNYSYERETSVELTDTFRDFIEKMQRREYDNVSPSPFEKKPRSSHLRIL